MTSTSTPQAELTGRIVRPGDADYRTASDSWNLLFSHDPAVIVFAQETQDVVHALNWARQNDVAVRVRSGGHCLEGWSTVDDGIVIDVSELKSAKIDTSWGTATVGAGLNQLEAVTTLGEAGVAAPTGTEGTVGLVGATLGGGFGLLTRSLGMASDNLLSAEVVVATNPAGAEVIIADENTNADLLWALRGAGNGNFGIVTSLTYRVHPLTQTVYLTATWAGLGDMRRVFDAWQRCAPHTDNRLTSQLEISGADGSSWSASWQGDRYDEAEHSCWRRSCRSAEPTSSTRDANWADTYADFQIPTVDEPVNWKFNSQFIYEPYPLEAVDLIDVIHV